MMSNSMDVDPGWFSPEVMQAVRAKQIYNLYGEAKYQGAIGAPVWPTNGIQMLVAAIGTDVVTGTVAPYTHTVSQANQLPSLTVEKNLGNFQSLRFAGCRVNKYTLKCAVGNHPVDATVDLIGQSAAIIGTPAAVSVINEPPFVFAEGSLTLFGNARAEVTNVTITIENGIKETRTYSGNHGPSFITPVTLKVSGSVDLVWTSLNDATYGDFTSMVNGTLGALQLSFTHPANAGAVTLNCPQVTLSKDNLDVKIADVIMSAINFEATQQLSSNSTISATILNGVSTAY